MIAAAGGNLRAPHSPAVGNTSAAHAAQRAREIELCVNDKDGILSDVTDGAETTTTEDRECTGFDEAKRRFLFRRTQEGSVRGCRRSATWGVLQDD